MAVIRKYRARQRNGRGLGAPRPSAYIHYCCQQFTPVACLRQCRSDTRRPFLDSQRPSAPGRTAVHDGHHTLPLARALLPLWYCPRPGFDGLQPILPEIGRQHSAGSPLPVGNGRCHLTPWFSRFGTTAVDRQSCFQVPQSGILGLSSRGLRLLTVGWRVLIYGCRLAGLLCGFGWLAVILNQMVKYRARP